MQRIEHANLSLVNQAYQMLKRLILEHQIPQGGKLNEAALAAALGISRTPVREAINRLAKEGLVESFPQRGAFVIRFSEDDVYELFLIRENLEGLAAYLAAEKMTGSDLATLESCIKGFKEPYGKREIQRYAREDFKFHETVIRLSNGRRLTNLISTLYDHIRIFRLTTRGLSDRMKTSLAEHRRIVGAFRDKDAAEAERLMRRHIRHVRDGVMENIKFFVGSGEKNLPERRRKEDDTL